jgi:pyruvate ferredoxin oxidoreductase alpha subunit
MRSLLEGSRAIAETVARCRPAVVPAYPITPQTHIVEALGAFIKAGTLSNSKFLTVDSEFAAMSAAIGASATGARTYTATASQGLLYMAEALFNAAGLGLPVVMTVANRAVGAPINIWNDHSDSMSQRDCGWIQLYAQDNQAAVDLHVLAFALAEEVSVPVMVCVDGFVLTHAFEPLEVPSQEAVDAFLPDYRPRQSLDPDEPVTIGAMVGPEAFTEVRYLAQLQQSWALGSFDKLGQDYQRQTGRPLELVSLYGDRRADTAVVVLGSVTGTMRAVAQEMADNGQGVRIVSPNMFRPFPAMAVREALAGARRVIVLERAFSPGAGGIVSADVRQSLAANGARIDTVIAGLGGRAVRSDSLRQMLIDAQADRLAGLTFLDLDTGLVEREIARMRQRRNSGPSTLNVLQDAALPGSRIS